MALTQLFANQAQTTLAGAITSTALTANLSPGSGVEFPAPGANQYFTMILNDAATGLEYEEVWVTNVTGDTITMLRGQEGSSAKAWSAGDIAFNGWTAGSATNLSQQGQSQANSFSYAVDTGGAANTYAVALTPALPTGVPGAIVYFRPAHTNTGASTLTVNGGTSYALLGGGQLALQGGEIFLNGFAAAEFNATLGDYVLLHCTGGALQIAPATQSNQAVQFSQLTGLVGSMRNAKMSVTAASSSGTFTADQVVVATALNGLEYLPPSFNQTINLAATGAGGMDTGSAPNSGYVALYAIYNPTTKTANILATNATSAVASTVYGGANPPAGYTASALISVWPTSAGGQFLIGYQDDRKIYFINNNVLTTSTQQASFTSLSISGAVPPNAKTAAGYMKVLSNNSGDYLGQTTGSSTGIGGNQTEGGFTSSNGVFSVPLVTPQTMFYAATVSVGTMTATINITSYTF